MTRFQQSVTFCRTSRALVSHRSAGIFGNRPRAGNSSEGEICHRQASLRVKIGKGHHANIVPCHGDNCLNVIRRAGNDDYKDTSFGVIFQRKGA